MFENLKEGWKIGRTVRRMVFSDKGLLAFPLLSMLVVFIETIVIFVPLAFVQASSLLSIILLFLYYLVAFFTSTYIVMAMLISFRAFESGERLGMGEAFSKTNEYAVQIFEWAMFEAIVTMIIRALESNRGRGGAAIAGIILGAITSFALSLASIFVIPVILDKKLGPISALKESGSFILKNFGKTFGGLLYSDLYTLAIIFGGFAIIIVGLALMFTISLFLVVVPIIGFIIMVFGFLLNHVMLNVFRLVIYDYVNSGKVPGGMDQELLKASIKQKKSILGT